MRYEVLRPAHPIDPRRLTLVTADDLYQRAPIIGSQYANPVGKCETETEAAKLVRSFYSGAVAMPFKVTIGSGETTLMGLVADPSKPIDPSGEIPFVLLVRAIGETDTDRQAIKRGTCFHRDTWKIQPVRPEIGKEYPVELRGADFEIPVFLNARVGHHDGKLTVHVKLPNDEMSVTFGEDVYLGGTKTERELAQVYLDYTKFIDKVVNRMLELGGEEAVGLELAKEWTGIIDRAKQYDPLLSSVAKGDGPTR